MIRDSFDENYRPVLKELGLEDFPARYLRIHTYSKKEYLFREECPVNCLMILLKGRAKVLAFGEDGQALLHSFCEQGGILGEVEMLTGASSAQLYVQAVTPVTCIAIPFSDGIPILRQNNAFLNRLSESLAHKLLSTNFNATRIALYTLEQRLCSYIEMTAQDGCFEERLTQVAELLGSSYRHLHRTLERLCAEHVLQKSGHAYFITDMEALHLRGGDFYTAK